MLEFYVSDIFRFCRIVVVSPILCFVSAGWLVFASILGGIVFDDGLWLVCLFGLYSVGAPALWVGSLFRFTSFLWPCCVLLRRLHCHPRFRVVY